MWQSDSTHRLQNVFTLAKADFLERARSPGFLTYLLAAVGLALTEITGYSTLTVDDHPIEPTAAGCAATTASITIVVLSFIGFFYVKGSTKYTSDESHRALLKAAGLSATNYLLIRYFTCLITLIAFALVELAATPVMQLFRGTHGSFAIGETLQVFGFLVVPALACVSALALLFETVPVLRGALGNVLYFAFWMFSLTLVKTKSFPLLDWTGLSVIYGQLSRGGSASIMLLMDRRLPFSHGSWNHVQFTWQTLGARLSWAALSVATVSPLSYALGIFGEPGRLSRFHTVPHWVHPELGLLRSRHAPSRTVNRVRNPSKLQTLYVAEFMMTIRAQKWWWWSTVAMVAAVSLHMSKAATSARLLVIAWLLPMSMWSHLAVRDVEINIDEIFRAVPSRGFLRIGTTWLVGISIALIAGSGTLSRLIVLGQWGWTAEVVSGAAFISALAIALGLLSRGAKLFEVVYLLFWYMGPVRADPSIDFMFTSPIFYGRKALLIGALTVSLLATAVAVQLRPERS